MDLNKSFLLPHVWQVVGGWLIVLTIILDVVLILCDAYSPDVIYLYPMVMWIPFYIGMMLVCLSKEKNDDEYIRCLRSRLVCIVVAMVFAVVIIGRIFDVYYMFFVPGVLSWRTNLPVALITNPVLYAIIYIVSLKFNLWVINRKIKKYAE